MNTQPKLSAVIALCGELSLLPRCLEALRSQSLSDIEIILVGSEPPEQSLSDDERFVFVEANGGLSRRRNAGLERASGEYIYFCRPDEQPNPDAFEKMYSACRRQELDYLCFDAAVDFASHEQRNANIAYEESFRHRRGYPESCTGEQLFTMMVRNGELCCRLCTQLARRSVLLDNKLRFNEEAFDSEELFTVRLMFAADKAAFLPQTLCRRSFVKQRSDCTAATRSLEEYYVTYIELLALLTRGGFSAESCSALAQYACGTLYPAMRSVYLSLSKAERAGLSFSLSGGSRALIAELCTRFERDAVLLSQEEENRRLRLDRAELQKKLSDCRRSKSYKIGRVLAFVPDKLAWARQCLKERGTADMLRLMKLRLRRVFLRSRPLVSVIVPVYNAQDYLEDCISSIRKQSLSRIEIILVDDGSTDASLEIMQRHAEQDKRIKLLKQENKYAGVARNHGLSVARGDYVIFLDADDMFEPSLLMESYMPAAEANADICLFGADRYYQPTGERYTPEWMLRTKFIPEKQPFCCADAPESFFQITTPCPWTKLFKRSFVLETGLQFQPLKNSNDVFFVYSALSRAKRIISVDKSLVVYRVGTGSSLQGSKKKDPFCFIEAYSGWRDSLKSSGLYELLGQSYAETCLSGCLTNLRSAGDDETGRRVFERLKANVFAELGLLDFDESCYANKGNYREMQRILKLSFEEYSRG